jgi:integrase
MDDRSAGKLGSGRVRKTDSTKHQRRYRKQIGTREALHDVLGPVSQQTVRHELVLLRRAIATYFEEHQLTLAHGQWLLAQHIMKMKLPERPESRETRLEDEPLKIVLRELGVPEHQCYVMLAIATTLRRAELCTLRWEDVDFERNLVKLKSPGHYKKKEESKDSNQKTKVRSRSVPLMPAAVLILRKLGPKSSGKLFSMTPGGYSQAWRRAADRAGLPDVRLHDMRREGISRLVELVEAPLQSVVAFSGHSDVGVLQRHYVKPRADIIVGTLANRPGAERLLPSAM